MYYKTYLKFKGEKFKMIIANKPSIKPVIIKYNLKKYNKYNFERLK